MIRFNDYKRELGVRSNEYLRSARRVLSSGWYILGKEVEDFENSFAKYLGVKYCVGVANGLEALQIALMAKGIGKGDEVITTPVSAMATTLSILAVGAKPVFVDINENGQIDESNIEPAISKRTKAVISVDLYGQPCELTEIEKICRRNKLFLIEDAAQAHGSKYKNKKLGTYGDVGCFSFYPTKNLGAFGDGGALVTNNQKYAKIFRILRDYGQESKYNHVAYGLNSRLDEFHAAFLKVKLKHLNKDNSARKELAARYVANLKGVSDLKLVLPEHLDDSNFHLFVIKTGKRDKLKDYLGKCGILALIHYPTAIPDQPLFGKRYRALKIPMSRQFVRQTLSLPCHPFLKISEVDMISAKLKKFFSDK